MCTDHAASIEGAQSLSLQSLGLMEMTRRFQGPLNRRGSLRTYRVYVP